MDMVSLETFFQVAPTTSFSFLLSSTLHLYRVGLRQVVESMISTQEQRVKQAESTMSFYSSQTTSSREQSSSIAGGYCNAQLFPNPPFLQSH